MAPEEGAGGKEGGKEGGKLSLKEKAARAAAPHSMHNYRIALLQASYPHPHPNPNPNAQP